MEYAGALAGGALGFIHTNVPGAAAGAYTGWKLGKSFNRKKTLNPGVKPLIKKYAKNYFLGPYGTRAYDWFSNRWYGSGSGNNTKILPKKSMSRRFGVSPKLINAKTRISYRKRKHRKSVSYPPKKWSKFKYASKFRRRGFSSF